MQSSRPPKAHIDR